MEEKETTLEWPRIIYHETAGIKAEGHNYTYKRCESLEDFTGLIDKGWELQPPEQREKLASFEAEPAVSETIAGPVDVVIMPNGSQIAFNGCDDKSDQIQGNAVEEVQDVQEKEQKESPKPKQKKATKKTAKKNSTKKK